MCHLLSMYILRIYMRWLIHMFCQEELSCYQTHVSIIHQVCVLWKLVSRRECCIR